jgi:hypothetical protein
MCRISQFLSLSAFANVWTSGRTEASAAGRFFSSLSPKSFFEKGIGLRLTNFPNGVIEYSSSLKVSRHKQLIM